MSARQAERLAWAVRHFTQSRIYAQQARDNGAIARARHWAAVARRDWAQVKLLLGGYDV